MRFSWTELRHGTAIGSFDTRQTECRTVLFTTSVAQCTARLAPISEFAEMDAFETLREEQFHSQTEIFCSALTTQHISGMRMFLDRKL